MKDWGLLHSGKLPRLIAHLLRSVGFETGVTGWQIKVDGTAEFQGDVELGGSVGFFGGAAAAQQSVDHGNTDGEIGGLTISGSYDQGEVQALRDKCEELADDVRSLRAALLAYALVAES